MAAGAPAAHPAVAVDGGGGDVASTTCGPANGSIGQGSTAAATPIVCAGPGQTAVAPSTAIQISIGPTINAPAGFDGVVVQANGNASVGALSRPTEVRRSCGVLLRGRDARLGGFDRDRRGRRRGR
jgi:hypothetical protein